MVCCNCHNSEDIRRLSISELMNKVMNKHVEIASYMKIQASNACITSKILAQLVFHIFVPALHPIEPIPI